jgi:hypothetical protein
MALEVVVVRSMDNVTGRGTPRPVVIAVVAVRPNAYAPRATVRVSQ